LYVYAVDRLVFSDFSDVRLDEKAISATGWGDPFNPEKHAVSMEIKAATYHSVSIEHDGGRWKVRVIFDV
jgi:SHS2 domain-containing protein